MALLKHKFNVTNTLLMASFILEYKLIKYVTTFKQHKVYYASVHCIPKGFKKFNRLYNTRYWRNIKEKN